MERQRAFMADDVWETILHKYIVPYRHLNRFCPPTFIGHKDGEPLLNKRFTNRLNDIANVVPDMKIDIYSHGLMLPKLSAQGKDFMQFLRGLPNKVRYMMSYHPYNHDGSVNDYSQVIEYMRDVLIDPPINVEFITVSHTSKWVTDKVQAAWRSVWQGLPITVHSNCSINPWTGRIESDVKFNGCPYADFGHWFFGVTGNIIACCLDLEEEIILGNVLKDDPEDMLKKTDEFYAEQRVLMNNGERVNHEVCANCYGQKRADEVPVNLIPLGVKIA